MLVVKEKFAVEHLKLPKDKVDLDEKAAARWKAEQEHVKQDFGGGIGDAVVASRIYRARAW